MAYKKNYRKRQSKCTYTDIAMKAWKGVKALKGIINSELKYHDQVLGNTSASSTGTVIPLTSIAQGDTNATRNGNSILAKSLYMKYQIEFNAASTGGAVVKMWLVQDKQQIADTTPAYTDIFENTNVFSFLNKNNIGRFNILSSKTFTYDTAKLQYQMEFTKQLNQHIRFNGTASTDLQKNHYYLVVATDILTNVPNYLYASRLTYYDN